MLVPSEILDGVTCEDVVAAATLLEDNSEECAALQSVEALCCPSVASTCSICKGTKLLADVEVGIADSTGTALNCGQVAYAAYIIETSSAACATYHSLEEYCCPDVFTSSEKSMVAREFSTMSINATSPSFPPPLFDSALRYVVALFRMFDCCISIPAHTLILSASFTLTLFHLSYSYLSTCP